MKFKNDIDKLVNLEIVYIRKIAKKNISLFININNKISLKKAEIDNLDDTNKWDKMKKIVNPYELIYTTHNRKKKNDSIALYKPISRSYFKLWEINNEYNLVDMSKNSLTISTLAEGPGGFLEALINIRNNKNDSYYGITLKNNSKYIPDWGKFSKASNIDDSGEKNLKIVYGNLYNINDVNEYCKFFEDKADIVTADGGFDYSVDFNGQEINSTKIIFCEVATAFIILRKGGNYVCKFFDLHTIPTIKILYILYCYFDEVFVYKPKTSRPANSERYIVCKNFKSCSEKEINNLKQLIKKWDDVVLEDRETIDFTNIKVPNQFIHDLYSYNKDYSEIQYYYLNKTLDYVNNIPDKKIYNSLLKKQVTNAVDWCIKNNIEINKESSYYAKFYKQEIL